MGSDGQEDGVVSFVKEVVQVFHTVIQVQFYPQVYDVLYLTVHDTGRQTELGHAHAQHAAGHRQGLVHGDAVAQFDQILGAGQAGRPCSDDRYALLAGARCRFDGLARFSIDHVGDESLERSDGDGLVHLAPVAGILATVVTNASADAGEGVVFLDDANGILVATLADQGDVSLGALVGGAGVPAGGNAQLGDGIGIGHSLGVKLVGRVTIVQVGVERVGQDNGADVGAIAATGTLVEVNVPGVEANRRREMASLALQAHYVGVGQ